MYRLRVKHPDSSEVKTVATTPNKDLPYVQGLARDYEKHGFEIIWENLSKLDYIN